MTVAATRPPMGLSFSPAATVACVGGFGAAAKVGETMPKPRPESERGRSE